MFMLIYLNDYLLLSIVVSVRQSVTQGCIVTSYVPADHRHWKLEINHLAYCLHDKFYLSISANWLCASFEPTLSFVILRNKRSSFIVKF